MYKCVCEGILIYLLWEGRRGVKITHSVGLRQFLIKVTSFTPANNSPNIFGENQEVSQH